MTTTAKCTIENERERTTERGERKRERECVWKHTQRMGKLKTKTHKKNNERRNV